MRVMQYCCGLPDVQFNSEIKMIVSHEYNFHLLSAIKIIEIILKKMCIRQSEN